MYKLLTRFRLTSFTNLTGFFLHQDMSRVYQIIFQSVVDSRELYENNQFSGLCPEWDLHHSSPLGSKLTLKLSNYQVNLNRYIALCTLYDVHTWVRVHSALRQYVYKQESIPFMWLSGLNTMYRLCTSIALLSTHSFILTTVTLEGWGWLCRKG